MSWFGMTDRQEQKKTKALSRGAAPSPGILRRKCSCEEKGGASGCEECRKKKDEPLRRSARSADDLSEAPPIVHDVLRTSGQPLDAATRAFFEPRFGHDFSHVRVHTDERAKQSADAVNAEAYTVGSHIVFASGFQGSAAGAPDRELLAHELTHTIQQRQVGPITSLRIGSAWDKEEHEARRNEHALTSPSRLRVESHGESGTVRGRGPIARPPVRMPAPAPPRTAGRGSARSQGPSAPADWQYLPDPHDSSLEALFRRAARTRAVDEARWELEQPVATLIRGGKSPHFVTKGPRQVAMYDWGNVTYEPHWFHILDAIEYEVGRAKTDEDLMDVLTEYIPSPIDALARQSFRLPRLRIGLRGLYIAPTFDPRGVARMKVYQKALKRRARTKRSLRKGPAAPATQVMDRARERGCSMRPIRGLGNDPLATLFCQTVTDSIFSYWIESPVGRAEIDALKGSTWYECKCGYGSLMEAAGKGKWWAARRFFALDEQVLRHRRIAEHCGLEYRFIASNARFADFLRNRWFSIPIETVTFEPCD